ncbi:MAG: hypothetical protein HY553_08390 [Elusimicrobia bacterium]|nr:hypothetical protein [Elusimicrobiota bacterium]
MAAIPGTPHPLAKAALRLGFGDDVVVAVHHAGQAIDTRVSALADELDPATGRAEARAIVAKIGSVSAGINESLYLGWYRGVLGSLNGDLKRLYPDWRTRDGLLFNLPGYTVGRG